MNEDKYKPVNPELTGKFIKSIRKYHNLTQDELADQLFITRKAVSKWETGVGLPSIDVAKRFCDLYGIKFEELIEGKVIFRKKELILNSTMISSLLILLTLFLTLYAAYQNTLTIYKFSFESDILNITNNKLYISKYYKHFSLGNLQFSNTKLYKSLYYLELYVNNNEKEVLYSCKYKNNICKNRFIKSTISKKFINKNINNFYMKVKYKNNNKIFTINKKINVYRIENKKNKRKQKSDHAFNTFTTFSHEDILLKKFNDNKKVVSNTRVIDLSKIYSSSKKELIKLSNQSIKTLKEKYDCKYLRKKSVISCENKNRSILIYLEQREIIVYSLGYKRIHKIENENLLYIVNSEENNYLINFFEFLL